MTIREKGYAHWEGQLKERRFPWAPITWLGIRLAFKRKYFKFILFSSLVPAIVFLVGIYISERMEDFQSMFRGNKQLLEVNPAYFKAYLCSDFLLFMMVMILVVSGAGLISDDLKHNSLQLYFARPLRKSGYLLGKASVIFFFLLLLTVVPGLVFIIFKLLFAGNFRFLASYPWLPLSVIGYSLFVTAFFCSYTLLLSSLSKNRRYVSILIFTVYILSDILFGFFYENYKQPAFALVSIKANLQQVGSWFLRLKPSYAVPWYWSLLILLAFVAAAVLVLNRKVRGVEVVR
jgi:ABC-type transport system involved in multi-copper enzyme maturation permease subunit